MNYSQALEQLRRRGNEVQSMHLGLERIAAIMRAFDNPQEEFPSLHIAGTNGKGSVAAMSESILRSAGLRTGLYTSPHLVRIEERIRVAGREIPRSTFADIAGEVWKREKRLLRSAQLERPLTYFEFVTACGFLYFSSAKIECAVVEVGLGGRYDATNIVRPVASLITGISYDHQQLLGNTLTLIAGEKAGIIKPHVPVFIGRQPATARRVLATTARQTGAPLIDVARTCRPVITADTGGRCTFDLQTPTRNYRGLRLALAGKHQVGNAALAVAATQQLNPGVRAVRQGLARTRWPGRLDEYRAKRRTLLDGAHNVEGAALLDEYLRERDERCIHLVFAVVRDKDIAGIGRRLFPLARTIHLTSMSNSRAAEPADIAAIHPRFRRLFRIHADPLRALEAAWTECPPDGLVVVTGSLYLVGEVLPRLQAVTRD